MTAPTSAPRSGAFVRPLAVIPRPVLRSTGALSELRIGPGGVGEIWAPSSVVEVTGRIAQPSVIADPPLSTELSPAFSVADSLPPVDVSSSSSEPPDASPSCSIHITSSPDISVAAIGVSESEEPPGLALSESDEPSASVPSIEPEPIGDNISAMTTAVFLGAVEEVIPFMDSELLMDDEPQPLIEIELIEPMEASHLTATPTIAMPVLEELSEPTLITETPHILRVTLPWPSAWKYEPPALPPPLPREPAPARTPALPFEVAPVAELDHSLGAAIDEELSAEAPLSEPLASISISIDVGRALMAEGSPPHDAVAPSADLEPSSLLAGAPGIFDASNPRPVIVDAPPELAPGIARADELLLRFGAGAESDIVMKTAAKSLRALAELDLTPSVAPFPVALIASSGSGLAPPPLLDSIDDQTPPATSPAPISAPIRRAPRGRFLVSAAAFAGGIAAATALVHVRPDFPDGVVALVAGVLPAHPIPQRPPPPGPSLGTATDIGAAEPLLEEPAREQTAEPSPSAVP